MVTICKATHMKTVINHFPWIASYHGNAVLLFDSQTTISIDITTIYFSGTTSAEEKFLQNF